MISAGVVPVGGSALDDNTAGAEVKEVTGAVWVIVVADAIVEAISGSGVDALAIGVVRGVSRIA